MPEGRAATVMRARLLLNLALLALALGLLAIALYQPGKNAPPAKQRFIHLDPAAVTGIKIVRAGQGTVSLCKDQDHWFLTEPLAVRANEVKIHTLLKFLETRSQEPLDAAPQDLKRFGLAEPRVRMEVNDVDIAFGDANPLSGERYVRYDGKIYLTPDTIYQELDQEAASLASPSLIEAGTAPTALVLPEHTLRREGTKWSITPADPQISADALVELVEAWKHSQAVTVRAAREGTARDVVTVELEAGAPLKFEIRSTEPELVLVRPDLKLEYHLFADSGKRLLHPKKKDAADARPAEPKP